MSERLIQALRRGGCAARQSGGWGIWRSHDRRGRCVGILPERVMTSLELMGDVGRLGTGTDIRVWTGTMGARASEGAGKRGTPRPVSPVAGSRRSSLEAVIDRLPDATQRAACRAAILQLKADIERAAAGQKLTQNWDPSLHVDGIGRWSSSGERYGGAIAASRRLERLAQVLDAPAQQRLHRLIIQELSLRRMAEASGLTIDRLAVQLARDLIGLMKAYRYIA